MVQKRKSHRQKAFPINRVCSHKTGYFNKLTQLYYKTASLSRKAAQPTSVFVGWAIKIEALYVLLFFVREFFSRTPRGEKMCWAFYKCTLFFFAFILYYNHINFAKGVFFMSLVNTKEMFKKAYEGGYAIGAFNVNNMEIVQGITEACRDTNSPVILQVSSGARKYANHTYLKKLIEAAVLETPVPIAWHLDHGDSFELCKSCIDGGFTSVMIDGSHLDYEENIALTKKVVDYAKPRNVTVEAELGRLAGIEDDVNVSDENASYTNPAQVEDFVEKTGVDSLAIAIGTSHGAYKFKPGQKPQLRFDILKEIEKRLPGFPIVLHGASSVIPEFVNKINANGGQMPDAIGIPEKMLRDAAKMAVCKINIDSDLRLAMTATVREYFAQNPSHFDPRQYLGPARKAIYNLVTHKLKNVLGCAGKA